MKYLKTYEKLYTLSDEEEEKYNIKKGDYVIANDKYYPFGPYFIDDLVMNEIGKVHCLFIDNKGNKNEQVYCEVLYHDVPKNIAKHISGNPFTFKHSVQIDRLRKVSPEEYKEYEIKKAGKKYNI